MVDEEPEDKENMVPLAKRSAAARRGRKQNDSDIKDQPPSSKRSKLDEKQEVVKVLEESQKDNDQSLYDSFQKKLVFKMINTIKDGQNKCGIDSIWKRYMQLSDRESMRKGTNEPLVADKEELMGIIEALENDNLVMVAHEDNQVILI